MDMVVMRVAIGGDGERCDGDRHTDVLVMRV